MRKIVYKFFHVIFCSRLLTSPVSDLIFSLSYSQIRQSAFIETTQKQTNKQTKTRTSIHKKARTYSHFNFQYKHSFTWNYISEICSSVYSVFEI